MISGATSPSQSIWPEIPTRTRRPGRGRLAAIAAGLAAASGIVFLLPPAMYRAQTIVAVVDPASPYAAVSVRAAASRAVSKQVLELAAQSLGESGVNGPRPNFGERVSIAFGFSSVPAANAPSRVVADLASHTSAHAGDVAGSLQVSVADDVAETAAKAADAVAQALVKVASDDAARAARQHARDAAAQLEAMRAKAIAARKHLAALGGIDADPAQLRAAAAAQVSAAQTRLDAIRNAIAAGNPPLSDRREMPPTIEALQSTYLDLKRQLAKARETLGDRHTTIISLQDEIRHGAAALTAEWHRLERAAEIELKAARARQSALPSADGPATIAKRDALADARREVEIADAAFVRAQAAQSATATDEPAVKILAPAVVPNAPGGWSIWLRGLAGLGGGLLAALATLAAVARLPMFAESAPDREDHRESEPQSTAARADSLAFPRGDTMREPLRSDSHRDRLLGRAEQRLEAAMRGLVPRFDMLDGAFGGVPTIVVATCDAAVRTTSVAVALARVAASDGRRVLLVEPLDRRPELAGFADLEAEPLVVDFFGTLRVALSTTRKGDALFLAPAFADGADIAAALVRNGNAEIVDDLAEAFDLIVVDAGEAEAAADEGWSGDAFLQVGTVASPQDGPHITSIFDAPAQAFLGTVVGCRLFDDMRAAPSRERPAADRAGFSRVTIGRAPQRSPYARAVAAAAKRARR